MKHTILILAVILIFSSFSVYAEESPSFWASADIEQAIIDGYVPRKLQGNYQKAITREKFCELAVSMLESFGKT